MLFSHGSRGSRREILSIDDRECRVIRTIHIMHFLYATIICSHTKNTQPAHTTALNQGTYNQQIYRNTVADTLDTAAPSNERERLRGTFAVRSVGNFVGRENERKRCCEKSVSGIYVVIHATRFIVKRKRKFTRIN